MIDDSVIETDQTSRLARLRRLLGGGEAKFGRYQELPPAVLRRCPDAAQIGYENDAHIPSDGPRYRWLKDNIDIAGLAVTEIGANIGYFALSAVDSGARSVHAYEPVAAFSEACAVLAEICCFEDRLVSINDGLTLGAVEALPEVDLVIMLNVLHHAGTVFDQDKVIGKGGWRAYARDYLERLAGFDAILLGAVGWPAEAPDRVTLAPLIGIRQAFDQYACVRPARLLPGLKGPLAGKGPADVDMLVVRENSEGEYDIIVDSDNRNLKNSIAQTHAALKVMRVAKAGKAVANVTEGEIPENLQQGGQNAIMVEVRI